MNQSTVASDLPTGVAMPVKGQLAVAAHLAKQGAPQEAPQSVPSAVAPLTAIPTAFLGPASAVVRSAALLAEAGMLYRTAATNGEHILSVCAADVHTVTTFAQSIMNQAFQAHQTVAALETMLQRPQFASRQDIMQHEIILSQFAETYRSLLNDRSAARQKSEETIRIVRTMNDETVTGLQEADVRLLHQTKQAWTHPAPVPDQALDAELHQLQQSSPEEYVIVCQSRLLQDRAELDQAVRNYDAVGRSASELASHLITAGNQVVYPAFQEVGKRTAAVSLKIADYIRGNHTAVQPLAEQLTQLGALIGSIERTAHLDTSLQMSVDVRIAELRLHIGNLYASRLAGEFKG